MGERIGSWKGIDVIEVEKYEYDTSGEIRPKKYIYAVSDGIIYLIKDDTIFARLLNEEDTKLLEERKYYRPTSKKYKKKFKDAEGEFTSSKATVSFNEDILPKGKEKKKSAGKRAANKTVDDWIGFGMNATVEEILEGLGKS